MGFGVRIGGKNIFKILQKHVKNVQNSYKITILGLKNAKNTTKTCQKQGWVRGGGKNNQNITLINVLY